MARVRVECPDCGYRFSCDPDEEKRKIDCPDCGVSFRPKSASSDNPYYSRRNSDDDDRPRSRDRDEDRDERRQRSSSSASSDDSVKKVAGGILSAVIIIGIIVLKVYLRSERDAERKRAAEVEIHQPVVLNPPQQPAFQQPKFEFQPVQVNPNFPKQGEVRPPVVNQAPPKDNGVPGQAKRAAPEAEHPELKAILGRWDARLPNGVTMSYTFFENGRYGLMKTDRDGGTSWAGEYEFVRSDNQGKRIILNRKAPSKPTRPLFTDEQDDGEVEIELFSSKIIRMKSHKLPNGSLMWRSFMKQG